MLKRGDNISAVETFGATVVPSLLKRPAFKDKVTI